MPLPSPKKNESKKDFLQRCHADPVVRKEFTEDGQVSAVCYSIWDRSKKKRAAKGEVIIQVGDNEYIGGEVEKEEEDIA